MIIYIAGCMHSQIHNYLYEHNIPKLFSYVNDKALIDQLVQLKKENKTSSKLFVDSGAFTMWTKGGCVDTDTYLQWLDERIDYIDLCGQVDIIPGKFGSKATEQQVDEAARLTWENYLYMRKKLKYRDKVLYTFHINEPLKYLQQALEWRDTDGSKIEYMAIGGLVGTPKLKRFELLTKCFEIVKHSSNPEIKIHAFGVTDLEILERFPFYSADSARALKTGGNGMILDNGGIVIGKESLYKKEHILHTSKENQDNLDKFLRKNYGYSLQDCVNDYKAREICCCLYLQNFANLYTHKPTKFIKRSLL